MYSWRVREGVFRQAQRQSIHAFMIPQHLLCLHPRATTVLTLTKLHRGYPINYDICHEVKGSKQKTSPRRIFDHGAKRTRKRVRLFCGED